MLEPARSTFKAHVGGDLLLGNDTWFRPVDCLLGPDGGLYIADWYDKRINHVDTVDNWDRTNGRIYCVQARDAHPDVRLGLNKMSSQALVDLLSHPNLWTVRSARRAQAERRDPAVLPRLRRLVLDERGQLALEALWALYVSGGFDDQLACTLLKHVNEDVRAWTVRLLGDARRLSPVCEESVLAAARRETSPVVRSQMACTAKRLPGRQAIPLVCALLQHADDVNDPQIPLLLWWAIEDKTISDRERVLGLLAKPEDWRNPLVRRFMVERISRRYMVEGNNEDLATCGRLLTMAPKSAERVLVVRGMEEALTGKPMKQVPDFLARQVAALWRERPDDLSLTCLAMRLGSAAAQKYALEQVVRADVSHQQRAQLIKVLGQLGRNDCISPLLQASGPHERDDVRAAALEALQGFADPAIADRVLALYPTMSAGTRARAQALLLGRPNSARKLVHAVDAGVVSATDLSFEQVRKILLFHDSALTALVEKHWGHLTPATAGEKRARIASVGHMLDLGRGNPARGKELFTKTCAICHTLFGEGNKIGPDLTGVDRHDRTFLITSIVDPNAAIRKEYISYVVTTSNGRVLTGLLAESTPRTITLLDGKNVRTLVARDDIEEMRPSLESLMPEKLLDPFDDQQICDLFSYLQSNGPAKKR